MAGFICQRALGQHWTAGSLLSPPPHSSHYSCERILPPLQVYRVVIWLNEFRNMHLEKRNVRWNDLKTWSWQRVPVQVLKQDPLLALYRVSWYCSLTVPQTDRCTVNLCFLGGGDPGVVAHSSQLVIQPCACCIQTQDAIIQHTAAPLNQAEHFRCLLASFYTLPYISAWRIWCYWKLLGYQQGFKITFMEWEQKFSCVTRVCKDGVWQSLVSVKEVAGCKMMLR